MDKNINQENPSSEPLSVSEKIGKSLFLKTVFGNKITTFLVILIFNLLCTAVWNLYSSGSIGTLKSIFFQSTPLQIIYLPMELIFGGILNANNYQKEAENVFKTVGIITGVIVILFMIIIGQFFSVINLNR
jgi:hypothetical protein